MPDRMHETLEGLRADLEHAPLADSSAVRRRGNQRSRNQAVLSAAAAVVALAAVAGVSLGLTGDDRALEQAPATQTPSTPAETAQALPPLSIDGLLQAEDLPKVASYRWQSGYDVPDAVQTDLPADQGFTACGELVSAAGRPRAAVFRTFSSDLDGRMWEYAAQYDSPAAAGAAFAALRSACDQSGHRSEAVDGLPAGASGFLAWKFSVDSEYFGELQGVAQTGDRVVVLGFSGMVRQDEVDRDAYAAGLPTAVNRLSGD